MNKNFNTKKEALKFIEKLSFRDYYQRAEILYRNKKWIVIYERC